MLYLCGRRYDIKTKKHLFIQYIENPKLMAMSVNVNSSCTIDTIVIFYGNRRPYTAFFLVFVGTVGCGNVVIDCVWVYTHVGMSDLSVHDSCFTLSAPIFCRICRNCRLWKCSYSVCMSIHTCRNVWFVGPWYLFHPQCIYFL